MQLRYAFFAGDIREDSDGQYQFQSIANGCHVATFPADITVACVLVIEGERPDIGTTLDVAVHVLAPPMNDAAGETLRVATRFRVRDARPGTMPGYEYVPVELTFSAPHAGAYEIHVDRSGIAWYLGFYRIEPNRHRHAR